MRISRGGIAVVAGSSAAVLVPPLWFSVRGMPRTATDEMSAAALSEINWEAPLTSPEVDAQISRYLFGGYTALSALALAGGVAVGMRTFDTSAALEAVEKEGGKKPTVEAEALAMRTAVRALGWGTALSVGAAVAGVLTAKFIIGIDSIAEFGQACDRALQPVNKTMQDQGRWVHARAASLEASGRVLGRWIGAPGCGTESPRAGCEIAERAGDGGS